MIDMKIPVPLGILMTLGMGLAVGAFHGFFITYVRVPPFIATLAGMLIFRGLTMVILKGQTKAPFDKSIQNIAAYNGIPYVLILLGSLIAIYTFITQQTIAGRHRGWSL